MENKRVRIVDIAEELGVSTATVSNVIHGKTKKNSDETVKRVQQLLEERQYIPSMAGILLAQNDSRIIGVVINNHEKYEGHVLEDPFVSSSLNHLSVEIEQAGYFMMIKTTTDLKDIVKFASMWNLEGMIIIGFCENEYDKLRQFMHIPFVVYDGYFENEGRVCNLTIDNFHGGLQVGKYFKELGHKRALCISDNQICVDLERFQGFQEGFGKENTDFMLIPMQKNERHHFYTEHLEKIREYSAVFAVSDYYAIDFMQFMQERGIRVPEDVSIAGFDDNPICEQVVPNLTSVRQDAGERARTALMMLSALKQGRQKEAKKELPVTLVKRTSTAKYTNN
ncbi:MAG: LacI family transcriptional regulator [Lachnospiraceae bacterium]|nr:LacI family transcriptional regulator [Lachnospiraceae bacterium]